MHTLTLKIQDSVLDKVVYFLSHLPKNEVEIVEDKIEPTAFQNESQIAKVFGSVQINMSNFKFDRDEANER